MGDAAGIYDNKIGPLRCFDLVKTKPFEKLTNLLAFILINFAAESIYGKGFHNMI